MSLRLDILSHDPIAPPEAPEPVKMDEMECPVCWEEMTPPKKIFQCRQGHAVCETCFENPQVKKCPTCRGHFIGRATTLEKIAMTLLCKEK